MKKYLLLPIVSFAFICSCTQRTIPFEGETDMSARMHQEKMRSEVITNSLFESEEATISEEDIQRLLDGDIKIPADSKVALYMIPSYPRHYYTYGSESYKKLHLNQIDNFANVIRSSEMIDQVSVLPSMLVPKRLTITTLREAAVRMQADLLVILSVTSDLYQNNKLFKRNEAKAFANSEMLIMDVRTGLIPITGVASEDVTLEKPDEAFNQQEFIASVLRSAVTKSLNSAAELGISGLKDL